MSRPAVQDPLSSRVRIGALEPGRLDEAAGLSRQAGWPHRREDWALVLSLSQGFAALDDDGRLVGTAMATCFGVDAATINMVLVDEGLRGRGVGRRLMDAALAACEGREQRLIATREGLPLYEKLGFRGVGEIAQHQGATPARGALRREIDWTRAGDDLSCVAALDREATGIDRGALLAALARAGEIGVLREAGRITGYVVLRSFGRGEVAGPVVAASQADARSLLDAAFARSTSDFVRVDTPDPGLGAWLAERGLAAVGGGLAMSRGPGHSPTSTARTYALASQALG
ncbi:MAG: GNAT family N-acetyltransferase [Alsobacter sp.]